MSDFARVKIGDPLPQHDGWVRVDAPDDIFCIRFVKLGTYTTVEFTIFELLAEVDPDQHIAWMIEETERAEAWAQAHPTTTEPA